MTPILCWNCGASALAEGAPVHVERRSDCRECHAELHCCRMCRHWDGRPGGRGCSEDRAEPPARADVANFCDWFALGGRAMGGADQGERASRSALDALFADADTGAAGDESADRPSAGCQLEGEREGKREGEGVSADDDASSSEESGADARARRARAGLDDLFG